MGNRDTKVCDWIGCFPPDGKAKVWTKTWVIMTIVKENVPDKQTATLLIKIVDVEGYEICR